MTNKKLFEKIGKVCDPKIEDEKDAVEKMDDKLDNPLDKKLRKRRNKTKGKATGSIALNQNVGKLTNKKDPYEKMLEKKSEMIEAKSYDGIHVDIIYEGSAYSFNSLLFDKLNSNDKKSSTIINKIKEMKNKDKYIGSLYEYVLEISKKGM